MNARALAVLFGIIAPYGALSDELPARYPVPSRPAPVEVVACCAEPPMWTGLYLGAQYGGAFSDPRWTFPFAENFNTLPGQNFSPSTSGQILGGHVGVNYQLHEHFLIGAEVSYVDNKLSSRTTGPIAAFPTDAFTIRAPDLFTAAGRVGFVHAQYLFYGRAGYASARLEITADSPVTGTTGRANQRDVGWLIGGGLESRIVSNVLFGLEYNYIGLSGDRFSGVTSGAVPGLPFNTDIGNLHMQTVTARLSVLFGPNMCCSRGSLER